jgi:putative addiction module component (TIGR02574 family)
MGHALQIPPPGFDDLTVEEKIEYIQALWDRIAAHPETVPVPESHREALAERISAHRAGEGEARPWPEVREEIRAELRKLRR